MLSLEVVEKGGKRPDGRKELTVRLTYNAA
jgi:hypothetical protein